MGCFQTLYLKGSDLSEGHQLEDKKLLPSPVSPPWPGCVRVMERPTRLGHDSCSTALSPAPTNWKKTPRLLDPGAGAPAHLMQRHAGEGPKPVSSTGQPAAPPLPQSLPLRGCKEEPKNMGTRGVLPQPLSG